MCGIAGWIGIGTDVAATVVPRVTEALRHRGPDAHGARTWPQATLIHTRLSIIDLSPAGVQPMSNEDGSIWTVFNGEIYNHRELRRWLEGRGHVFKGRSDTEVLPHLYEEDGTEFLGRLRGMFALAIYDTRSQRLVLARDRFGIKPLFYAALRDRVMFASEIRGLLEMPGVDRRPDRQAIHDFAALFYIPAPQTAFIGVRSLCPGEMLDARLEGSALAHHLCRFHHWNVAPDPRLTLADAESKAAELLMSAVGRQLESDVPSAALLSGGIDSSLVSVAAQAAGDGQLRTFNVRFADPEYDETWAAQAVASHIRSRHDTLEMADVSGTWDGVTDLLRHAGQPFADTSLFAVNAVCRVMRQHVTVALSGDGGDEGFGGYAVYGQIGLLARWLALPHPVCQGTALAAAGLERVGLAPDRMSARLREVAGADDAAVIQSLLCWVRHDEHRRLCSDEGLLPVRRLFEPQWEHNRRNAHGRLERLSSQATEVYTRLVMPNDFLFKVDTASMRESLEVRVPMLDEDLFAFGLSLPHHLKATRRTCKRVLRAVAHNWLPSVVANKPKRGFEIPVDRWVTNDFRSRLRETLLGPSSRLPEFFRPAAYRPIVEAFTESRPCSGISRQGLYQRAIMLLSVHVTFDTRQSSA